MRQPTPSLARRNGSPGLRLLPTPCGQFPRNKSAAGIAGLPYTCQSQANGAATDLLGLGEFFSFKPFERGFAVNVLLLSMPLFASVGGTQNAPELLNASTTRLVVTSEGAYQTSVTQNAPASASTTQSLTTGGALWTHPDGGLAWIGASVALGNCGTEVFAEYDLNNEAAELFSAFDADPPTAIWSDASPTGLEGHIVASASDANVHFAANQFYVGGDPNVRQTTVRKYTSSSSTPDWTYTFPTITTGGAKVAVSSDGSTLVAAIMDSANLSVEIAVFSPGSGTPISSTTLPPQASASLRGFDLSEDGTTLYYSQGADAYIFDVATKSILFSTSIGASFDSHAISGDGSVFAFGNFNVMRVFTKSGATYLNTVTKNLGGQVYCSMLDLSADSSTLAYAWYFYNPGTAIRIEALNVATGNVTMTHNSTGVSGLQNVIADISMCDDGSRFAVGLWGDQAGPAQELAIYSSTQNAPLTSLNLGGSIFAVDISSDGQRAAASGKAVHANTFGNGGNLTVIDAGGQDFTLRGSPRIGSSPNLEVFGPANKPAVLLSSHLPQSPPATFPGIGTLYVNRPTLIFTALGSTNGSGELTAPYPIANSPGLIGTNQYLQVLFLSPRVLSVDWAKVTFLP